MLLPNIKIFHKPQRHNKTMPLSIPPGSQSSHLTDISNKHISALQGLLSHGRPDKHRHPRHDLTYRSRGKSARGPCRRWCRRWRRRSHASSCARRSTSSSPLYWTALLAARHEGGLRQASVAHELLLLELKSYTAHSWLYMSTNIGYFGSLAVW